MCFYFYEQDFYYLLSLSLNGKKFNAILLYVEIEDSSLSLSLSTDTSFLLVFFDYTKVHIWY